MCHAFESLRAKLQSSLLQAHLCYSLQHKTQSELGSSSTTLLPVRRRITREDGYVIWMDWLRTTTTADPLFDGTILPYFAVS